jgi:uncharacterized protein YcbX
MKVVQLWRYPVKSMAGERLESAAVTLRGIPGDRGWAVFDDVRGGVTNGKRLSPLRMCRPRYVQEPVAGAASPLVEIAFPDGASARCDSSEAATRLSALVGRSVSLRGLGPVGTDAAPRLTMDMETPEVVRELNGLEPGEPMQDYSELPPEKLRMLRQGNFFDALPIHLISRTTLRTLARIAPESDWDERRFRMNLLVDADDGSDYPEMGWIGRRLRVGTAVLEIAMGCPRCVMVTQPADELPQDRQVMRTLVRETKHIAGIYAGVAQAGEVRTGDTIELLPA